MADVLLAQFDMGMQDGKILQWYVAEGDRVVQGQPICEVEAAKAVVEIEAPASGILSRIVVKAEEVAQVRDLIAVIDDGSSPVSTTASTAPKSNERPAPKSSDNRGTRASDSPSVQVEPRARRLAGELGVNLNDVQGSGPGGRITTADVERAATSAR